MKHHTTTPKLLLLLLGLLSVGQLSAQRFDPNFEVSVTRPGEITQFTALPGGKVLVAGQFRFVNGQEARGMVRLLENGNLDNAFNYEPTEITVTAYGILPDNRLLVGGEYRNAQGERKFLVFRLEEDGAIDYSFLEITDIDRPVRSILPLPDGSALIGGSFSVFNGQEKEGLVLLGPGGQLQTGFPLPEDQHVLVNAITRSDDGKHILIAGRYGNLGQVWRFDIHGRPVGDFVFSPLLPDGNELLDIWEIQSAVDGRLALTANSFFLKPALIVLRANGEYQEHTYMDISSKRMRITPNGEIYLSTNKDRQENLYHYADNQELLPVNTGANPDGQITDFQILADGSILLGGNFSQFGGRDAYSMVKLHPDGQIDPSFNPAFERPGRINAIKLLEDRKVLVGGTFTAINGRRVRNLARITPDGTHDPSFAGPPNMDPRNEINDLQIQEDGKILTAGSYQHLLSEPYYAISRLHPDGRIDHSFHPDTSEYLVGDVKGLLITPQDQILAYGDFFIKVEDQFQRKILRYNRDGSLDRSFFDLIQAQEINDIELAAGNMLLLAGKNITVSGSAPSDLVRVNQFIQPDINFNPQLELRSEEDPDYRVVIQEDHKILLAGNFEAVSGDSVYHDLIRLHPDGRMDTTFQLDGPSAALVDGGYPEEVKVLSDGRLLIAGRNHQPEEGKLSSPVILNPDGSLADSLKLAYEGTMNRITMQDDTTAYAAGEFVAGPSKQHASLGKILISDAQIITSTSEEPFPQELYLYPNPFMETITLELAYQYEGTFPVVVTNMLGQTMKRLSVDSYGQQKHIIDLADLPKGMYMLTAHLDNRTISKKIIKQ